MKKVCCFEMNRLAFSFFLILISSISFFACHMNASNLKDSLEERISYANSPEVNYRIMSNQGTTSPSGDKVNKPTDTVEISFSPYTDYQFIKWQLVDRATNKVYTDEEAAELIEFEDSRLSQTSFTIKKYAENLLIEPLCGIRPQALSCSPIYKPSGVFRDSTIQVMFNKKIDPASIYYTTEELKELGITDLGDLLYDTLNAPESFDSITIQNKVYGYKKDGQKHYKNITITNLNGDTNLLNYFGAPYFESEDQLSIPTYSYRVDSSAVQKDSPKAGTQIVVNVENLFYTEKETQVFMNNAIKWNYLTSKEEDNTEPSGSDFKYYKSSGEQITSKENLTDKKLYVTGIVNDNESGPANYLIIRVKDQNTSDINSYYDYKLYFTDFSDKYEHKLGTEKEPILVDLSDLPEGEYSVQPILSDLSGNTTKYDYEIIYFAIDSTPPELDVTLSKGSTDGYVKAEMTTSPDAAIVNIQYKKSTEDDSAYTEKCAVLEGEPGWVNYREYIKVTKEILLNCGESYDLRFTSSDNWGNSTTVNKTFYVRPAAVTYPSVTNGSNKTKSLKVTWKEPTKGNFTGTYVVWGDKSSIFGASGFYNQPKTGAENSYEIQDLIPGTNYYVWLVSYVGEVSQRDIREQKAENICITQATSTFATTYPAAPRNVRAVKNANGTITVSWDPPAEGRYDSYYVGAGSTITGALSRMSLYSPGIVQKGQTSNTYTLNTNVTHIAVFTRIQPDTSKNSYLYSDVTPSSSIDSSAVKDTPIIIVKQFGAITVKKNEDSSFNLSFTTPSKSDVATLKWTHIYEENGKKETLYETTSTATTRIIDNYAFYDSSQNAYKFVFTPVYYQTVDDKYYNMNGISTVVELSY